MMTREKALQSINCIDRICCPPSASSASDRAKFLCALGCDEANADIIAKEFERLGLAFCNHELTDAIAQLADHPGRRVPRPHQFA